MSAPNRSARATAAACTAIWLACGLAALGAAAAEDEALRAGDFAVGRTISLSSRWAVQSATLDLDVYRNSVEPRLADLRVFNGAGETVPHAIRPPISAPGQQPAPEPLPVFRLEKAEESSSDGTGYHIDAEISESGAILSMRGGGARLPGPAGSGAWLVDASAVRGKAIVGLELELAPSAGDFVGYLRIAASNDLASFRTVTPRAAVARLTRGGHGIERLDLSLPATKARYIKLELIEGVLPADVLGVTASLSASPAPVERRHTRVRGEALDDEAGTYLYDMGAHPRIDRVDVLLDQPNTLLEIRIESAQQPEGPWQSRHTGLIYRLEQGDTLRSPPIQWRSRGHRYLRLTISAKGGGRAITAPEIELAWRPEQLLFVARGGPPFTLVYGKRGAEGTAFPASQLARIAGAETSALDEPSAELGPPQTLAGRAAFQEPRRPTPWRQIALWAVLLAAVGIVLAMSARLLRQVSDEPGGGPA